MTDMSTDTPFDAGMKIKRALQVVEDEHPGSAAVKVLHARLARALASHGESAGLSLDEVTALSGGTKPPSP